MNKNAKIGVGAVIILIIVAVFMSLSDPMDDPNYAVNGRLTHLESGVRRQAEWWLRLSPIGAAFMKKIETQMRAVLAQRDHENKESLRALAKRTGVAYSKVIYWNTRFERREGRREAAASFVPVRVVPGPIAKNVPATSFEVVIGRGHRVVVPAGFHSAELSRLIGVLQSC